MNELGIKPKNQSIADIGLGNVSMAYWNLHPSELVEETILVGDGQLTDVGALAIDTGNLQDARQKINLLC